MENILKISPIFKYFKNKLFKLYSTDVDFVSRQPHGWAPCDQTF